MAIGIPMRMLRSSREMSVADTNFIGYCRSLGER
jgi:hypothetical protein